MDSANMSITKDITVCLEWNTIVMEIILEVN